MNAEAQEAGERGLRGAPAKIAIVAVVFALVVLGLYSVVQLHGHPQASPNRSTPAVGDTVVCQWEVVYGHSIQSAVVSGNTTIITGTGAFNPIGTYTTSVTASGYPQGTVGSVTTVTTDVYAPTETCVYVTG